MQTLMLSLTSEHTAFEEHISRMEYTTQNIASNVIHQVSFNTKPLSLSQIQRD